MFARARRVSRAGATVAAICGGCMALGLMAPAGASVADSYCSPTGDYCTAVLKKHGRIKLEIRTFSFERYELCVRGDGVKRCEIRSVQMIGDGVMADRVDAAREFIRVPGEYKAVWRFDGTRLGPGLRFRIRT